MSSDFGSKLREARERRGLSLREISSATKIAPAFLEALERNDISKLPGGLFSRAFVRAYAVEVGLDPETMIQEFIDAFQRESVTVGHPTADQVEDTLATESHRRIARTVARLIAVSLPIAALVLYLGTAGRRVARSTDPPADTTGSAPAPAAAPPAAAPSPERPAAMAGRVPAPAAIPPKPPAATAPIAPAAERPRSTDAADVLTISLLVRTPCVVSAIVDGKKAIDQVLRPGDRRTVEVRREIMLTVGDASAVVMTLNGAAARPLGKAGDVVTARLTPANFKNYLSQR